jgi:hypothetical protein
MVGLFLSVSGMNTSTTKQQEVITLFMEGIPMVRISDNSGLNYNEVRRIVCEQLGTDRPARARKEMQCQSVEADDSGLVDIKAKFKVRSIKLMNLFLSGWSMVDLSRKFRITTTLLRNQLLTYAGNKYKGSLLEWRRDVFLGRVAPPKGFDSSYKCRLVNSMARGFDTPESSVRKINHRLLTCVKRINDGCLDGGTLQALADEVGTTREYIRQVASAMENVGFEITRTRRKQNNKIIK